MSRSPVFLALILTALALPVSIAAANISLGLLTVALLIRARRDGHRMLEVWSAEPAMLALVLYATVGMVAAAFCDSPIAALRDALKDLHRLWALGLFTAALALEPEVPLAAALGSAFAAMAAFGVGQFFVGAPTNWRMIRARGFVHAVVFGEQMALGLLGAAALLLRPPRTRRTALAAAFAAVVFAALVMSQTRMALISAAAAFVLLCVFEPRARRWAALALVLFVVAAAAWERMPNHGRSLSAVFARYDPKDPQQVRWTLWRVGWRMFRDHPVAGVGPGGYRRHFAEYHQGELDGESVWGSAHNLYLHQAAERGALGLAALLALLGVLLARAWLAARAAGDARSLWSVAAVAIMLLMSMTEISLQSEQFSALFLLVWAWGTVSLRPAGQIL